MQISKRKQVRSTSQEPFPRCADSLPLSKRVYLLAVSLIAALSISIANAAEQEPLIKNFDLAQAASHSSEVFVGQVIKTESKWIGKVIVTQAQVRPFQNIKGNVGSQLVTVSTYGGTVGNIKMTAQHIPSIQKNELAIFFVRDAGEKSLIGKGTKVFATEKGKLPLTSTVNTKELFEQDARLQSLINALQKKIQK